MPRSYREISRYSYRNGQYSSNDSSNRRSYRRSRSPRYVERHEIEAVRLDERGVPLQLRETRQLEVTRVKQRRTDSEDDVDDDEVRETMRVSRRERKEILQRREERQREYERNDHRRRRADEPSPKRERLEHPRTEYSGPSMFNQAENFTITGGQMSAVGHDQTIIGTPERYSSQRLPGRSDNRYGRSKRTTGERDAYSAPSGKKRYRAEPSSPAKPIADTEISGPNLFSFAKNFEIESGNFAAVGSNQAIMYRRRRDDQYVDDHKSDRSNIASRKDPPKVTEATPSTSSLNPGPTKDSTSYADRSASAARPRRPSTKAPISGPSVLAYSSGFSLRGSRAGPGSFSAVGGDQNVVFAEDDLSDSEYHG